MAVLGASNYTYAEPIPSQKLGDWVGVHTRMAEYFGGSTKLWVPEQLKSAVRVACRYEPDINRTYQELAGHYGAVVVPARPGQAKDKAKVEGGVLIAQRWIVARLRPRTFFEHEELDEVLGNLHRGVEKLAEDGTNHQFIPHTDRLDYVCAMYNNFAYCRAVEKLMNITVPDRAEYLRTIVAEIQRIIGHQFWLGTQALDIRAMGVFFYCFRDREILMDWFDELCGARLTTSWYRIGGVERDFTPSLFGKLKQFLDYFPPKIDEYVVFLEKNRIWLGRTKGVAIISAEDAVSFGLSGPTLRGSGVDYDLRKAEPYSAYAKCEFSVPLGKNGDTYDRYWIRVQELYESIKIIRQCLEQFRTFLPIREYYLP